MLAIRHIWPSHPHSRTKYALRTQRIIHDLSGKICARQTRARTRVCLFEHNLCLLNLHRYSYISQSVRSASICKRYIHVYTYNICIYNNTRCILAGSAQMLTACARARAAQSLAHARASCSETSWRLCARLAVSALCVCAALWTDIWNLNI